MRYFLYAGTAGKVIVEAYTDCGGYLYRLSFLAGNPGDTATEVKAFFQRNTDRAHDVEYRNGHQSPAIPEIVEWLLSSGRVVRFAGAGLMQTLYPR